MIEVLNFWFKEEADFDVEENQKHHWEEIEKYDDS